MTDVVEIEADMLGELWEKPGKAQKAGRKPPVKNAPEDRAVSDRVYSNAAGDLRQFADQVDQLDKEISDLKDGLKDVFAEAKARGYDTKALRKVIALRRRDKDDVAAEDAILETYKTALGMV